MTVHVKLQFVLPSKALPAPLTGEGSLSGVSPDVSVEVRHPGELGLAVGAGVRTDAVVDLNSQIFLYILQRERDVSPFPRPTSVNAGPATFVNT